MVKHWLDIYIALIILTLGLCSCSKQQDGEVIVRDFDGEMWGRFDYIETTYNVVKAPITADLVMEIEVSDVYPNIYPYHEGNDGLFPIALSINAPDGSSRSREFNFKLKDKDGNFKSEKVNGYYRYELPLIGEMSFDDVGEYHFKIENKYSKDPMYGIKRLSVNCLQIKTKK